MRSTPPSRSWMSAACTMACIKRPCVSTRMCRFLPLIFCPHRSRAGRCKAPFFSAFHALAVDDRGRRGSLALRAFATFDIERVMDAIERAVPAPQIEIIVQGRAWRQVFWNRAPLAARAQDVHQTVSNLAQVHRALITTRLGRREAWLDQRPLRIGQVAWIAQVVAVIAGTIFGRPHRQRLPQNQAATLESQPIHPIQYLPGQTLRTPVQYISKISGQEIRSAIAELGCRAKWDASE